MEFELHAAQLHLTFRACLLDSGAAPLNQDDQHDDKQHARHDTDDHCIVHFPFSLPLSF